MIDEICLTLYAVDILAIQSEITSFHFAYHKIFPSGWLNNKLRKSLLYNNNRISKWEPCIAMIKTQHTGHPYRFRICVKNWVILRLFFMHFLPWPKKSNEQFIILSRAKKIMSNCEMFCFLRWSELENYFYWAFFVWLIRYECLHLPTMSKTKKNTFLYIFLTRQLRYKKKFEANISWYIV